MKKLDLLKSLIYVLVSTSKEIKAKSIGTSGDTIIVETGRQMYKITVEKVEEPK